MKKISGMKNGSFFVGTIGFIKKTDDPFFEIFYNNNCYKKKIDLGNVIPKLTQRQPSR